jgi:hypothetical protein
VGKKLPKLKDKKKSESDLSETLNYGRLKGVKKYSIALKWLNVSFPIIAHIISHFFNL